MEKINYDYEVRTTMKQWKMYIVKDVMKNSDLDHLMSLGWVILSSWVDNPKASWTTDRFLNIEEISFRLARNNSRMIVTACVTVPIPDEILLNIDADEPGSISGIMPSYKNELWLMRAAAVWGYGTGRSGSTGSWTRCESQDFSIVGLDIEMISICITNSGWYEQKKDLCYCIYSFGHCSTMSLEEGRNPVIIKVKDSTKMCEEAYKIIESLSPDIVNIHNGFGFDLKRIAASSSQSKLLNDKTERRRLGNSRSGVYWRLPNGTMIIDSMYDADKYLRAKWDSISLASMAKMLELPPKLDGVEMVVEKSDDYDVTEMMRYNVCAAKEYALET